MIYTENPVIDRNNILRYIDDYYGAKGENEIQVDSQEVLAVCLRMRADFPHVEGIGKASAFKKVANFVAHFLELRPIKSAPRDEIEGLDSYNSNAVIALDIAIACLEGSTLTRDDGSTKKVTASIYISNHSYADIIHALSSRHITQQTHYHILAVFFEQLTYKTNSQCEYKDTNSSEDETVSAYYPYYPPDGDDMNGL